TRRRAIGAALSVVTAATAAIAGLSLLLRGSYRPTRTLNASVPASSSPASGHTHTSTGAHTSTDAHTATEAGAGTSGTSGTSGTASSLPSGAVKLGAGSRLPAGQGATYPDPGNGQPDIVIRQSDGTLVAHSAVCPHAGCTVDYQGGQIVCPCHGSIFNAQTGAVITGPASTPLAPRKVLEHGGEIYALPA
ncbi:MAG: Rieske (2Fe-2S) protein, partial [Solirubrobacteraceae bacterium]